jgi:hypothetical protein
MATEARPRVRGITIAEIARRLTRIEDHAKLPRRFRTDANGAEPGGVRRRRVAVRPRRRRKEIFFLVTIRLRLNIVHHFARGKRRAHVKTGARRKPDALSHAREPMS